MVAGNPARRCRLSFSFLNISKYEILILWCFKCYKLEELWFRVIGKVSTSVFSKKSCDLQCKNEDIVNGPGLSRVNSTVLNSEDSLKQQLVKCYDIKNG